MDRFSKENFHSQIDSLAKKNIVFKKVLSTYGYPPMWTRTAGFATLIHIILEQQVSLASAKAAFLKLKARIKYITPERLLELSDEEMKACYFSRQKTVYARELARMIIAKELRLDKFQSMTEPQVRVELKKVKGIGDWTVDIYLMFALQHSDVFPTGDLALMQSLKKIMQLPAGTTKEEILSIAENWRPHRSLATMLFWHHYLEEKRVKAEPKS